MNFKRFCFFTLLISVFVLSSFWGNLSYSVVDVGSQPSGNPGGEYAAPPEPCSPNCPESHIAGPERYAETAFDPNHVLMRGDSEEGTR